MVAAFGVGALLMLLAVWACNRWAGHKQRQPNREHSERDITLSPDQQAALSAVLEPNWDTECILIYGSAGTGKSTIIHKIVEALNGQAIVAAPFGIAALNVGGTTINRLIGIGPFAIPYDQMAHLVHMLDEDRREVMREAKVVIIDEVSTLRVDLMDALDYSLRINLGAPDVPFGGKKVVLVGDLMQLDPVVAQDGPQLTAWDGHMFFHGKVWQQARLRAIKLTQAHAFEKDPEFAEALQQLRSVETRLAAINWINQRMIVAHNDGGRVVIATTNADANGINEQRLAALPPPPHTYHGETDGDFLAGDMRTSMHLTLKIGARVVVVANDRERPPQFANGTLAEVRHMGDDSVEIEKDDGESIVLHQYQWNRLEPKLNDAGQLVHEPVAWFRQIPLKLAWAFTVQRAQGLRFDAVHVLPGHNGFFASGHAYVAISRCRTISGLSCIYPFNMAHFWWAPSLLRFLEEIEENPIWPA